VLFKKGVLESDTCQVVGMFLFTTASRTALGPGIKLPGREDYHLPPSTAKVRNAWSYTSTPSTSLHCVVLG